MCTIYIFMSPAFYSLSEVSVKFCQDRFCFLPVQLLENCHTHINESSYTLGDKHSTKLKGNVLGMITEN